LALGVTLLFLPLLGIHREMIRVKEEEEKSIRLKRKDVLFNGKSPENESKQPFSDIAELLKLQALDAEASQIPTWPFETRTVERLVAIILTIFTAILVNLVTVRVGS